MALLEQPDSQSPPVQKPEVQLAPGSQQYWPKPPQAQVPPPLQLRLAAQDPPSQQSWVPAPHWPWQVPWMQTAEPLQVRLLPPLLQHGWVLPPQGMQVLVPPKSQV
jgi:hypothetical protein